MAEMSDLIQNLYNSLQAKFGTPGDSLGPGSLFLAFERLGIGLSANDFKLQPTDAAFNPAIAAQHGATLVNFVAQLDPDGFIMPRGDLSPTVTGQYDQILSAASYGAQPASDDAVAAFLQSKGIARRTFDETQVSVDVAQCYWPASFVPAVWFDDQDSTIWSAYSSSTGESTTADSPPPTPSPAPTMVRTDWSWRVITPDVSPNLDLVRRLQATPAPQRYASDVYRSNIAAFSSAATATAARPDLVMPAVGNFAAQPAAPAAMSFAAAPTERLAFSRLATPATPTATFTRSAALTAVEWPRAPDVAVTGMRLNPITATNAAFSSLVSNLPVQPTSSKNFQLSFQYCVANISRPWLSSDFLTAATWYLPGLSAGGLARGSYQKGSQRFAYLPTKLLVVKDLTITAQWSDQDRAFAQSSASLGPFSLLNTQFEKDTLTAPGMQIIAWFCQVVPTLPAIADPAVATPVAVT